MIGERGHVRVLIFVGQSAFDLFFFFQAEDGIRDDLVTGVQTCALPILSELGKGDIPKGAQFVEIAVKNISEKYPVSSGLKITTSSEFSSQFGFGSSSAATVCTIKALAEQIGRAHV